MPMVPVKIEWGASDRNEGAMDECKAMAVALFDKDHRDTLRIDLWTKEMQVLRNGSLYVSDPAFVEPDLPESNSKQGISRRNGQIRSLLRPENGNYSERGMIEVVIC